MSPENCKIISVAARLAGDELKGKLPPLADHPIRNSYAHVWKEIKLKFNVESYKACSDEQVTVILELIEFTKNNPC